MKILKYIVVLVVVIFISSLIANTTTKENNVENKTFNLCYLNKIVSPDAKFTDEYNLKLNLMDKNKVTGEFDILWDEKDLRIGVFEGSIEDETNMTRAINAKIGASKEGVHVEQEFYVLLEGDTAIINSQETHDRGDGFYV